MTHEQLDRIVRQANPVPDLKALEPVDASVLVLDKQRRTEMQTHDRIEIDKEPEKPRYGPLIGIAAAAAVVIGVLVLFRPVGNAPVAGQPAAAVDVATAFVEAYAALDADQAASYLTEDARGTILSSFEGLQGLRLEVGHAEASGFKLLLDGCGELTTSASGTIVRCTYDYHGIRSDEIGLGPYSGSWFVLTILDGKIVSVSNNIVFMENGFSAQMWEPFAQWVSENYPEDVLVLYTDGSQRMQRITEEANELWEQRSREYVPVAREGAAAVETATAFVEAFGDFDVDRAASYLAADADLSSFEWDGGDWRLANRLLQAQGFRLLLDSCDEPDSLTSSTVRCTFDFHALRSDEIGLGPFSGSTFDVTVVDGEITRASMQLNYRPEFSPQMWEPFAEWVAETYPEDVDIMYTNSLQTLERLTEESIALWEQRTREYVEVVKGTSG